MPLTYRVGPLGLVRPVTYVPVYHPPVTVPGYYTYRTARVPYAAQPPCSPYRPTYRPVQTCPHYAW
jgi:hypothetical protein